MIKAEISLSMRPLATRRLGAAALFAAGLALAAVAALVGWQQSQEEARLCLAAASCSKGTSAGLFFLAFALFAASLESAARLWQRR